MPMRYESIRWREDMRYGSIRWREDMRYESIRWQEDTREREREMFNIVDTLEM